MPTADQVKRILRSQFEAALCMLHECIEKCPESHWDDPIAKYPFWHVAYHTLCYVDCYLGPSDAAWTPRTNLHPAGRAELEEEYPSRRFTKTEMLAYIAVCRERLELVLGDGPGSETTAILDNPSGFPWLPFTRTELHLYNIRHVQHHTGQLGALLRRVGVEMKWVKAGWR